MFEPITVDKHGSSAFGALEEKKEDEKESMEKKKRMNVQEKHFAFAKRSFAAWSLQLHLSVCRQVRKQHTEGLWLHAQLLHTTPQFAL